MFVFLSLTSLLFPEIRRIPCSIDWNSVQTPNLDALAQNALLLTNYYVQPTCAPTRSALMSGRYPIHDGMQYMVPCVAEPYGLPTSLTILPEQIKKAGYNTHIIGFVDLCCRIIFS